MITCRHCGAETSNGLALCALCQRKAADCLESLPVYFRNLARWRPGQAGSRQVPGSREPRGPQTAAGDRVSRALDEAGADLTTWAKALADDRREVLAHRPLEALFADLGTADLTEAEVVALQCAGFQRHMTSLSTLDWCGEFVTRIGEHQENLHALTTEAVPGWYAGGCKRCGSGTYVVPGLTWVTCTACGVTTFARDHLDTILDEARWWLARPKALAGALVALLDTELSVERLYDRIRQWEVRERLTGRRKVDAEGDEVGPKRYYLGDVLDILTAEAAAKRAAEEAARKARLAEGGRQAC